MLLKLIAYRYYLYQIYSRNTELSETINYRRILFRKFLQVANFCNSFNDLTLCEALLHYWHKNTF